MERKVFTVRLSVETYDRITFLSDRYGMSQNAVVSMLVNDRWLLENGRDVLSDSEQEKPAEKNFDKAKSQMVLRSNTRDKALMMKDNQHLQMVKKRKQVAINKQKRLMQQKLQRSQRQRIQRQRTLQQRKLRQSAIRRRQMNQRR